MLSNEVYIAGERLETSSEGDRRLVVTSDHIDDLGGLSDALPIGSAIGGFTLRRVLGKGGFGITYEAQNRVTERMAAIKEFFPSRMARRDARSRLIYSMDNAETVTWALRKFEETTTTLCGLSHPNIVKVFDYVPLNNTGYMVMELLKGLTLQDHLRGRLTPPSLDELRPLIDPIIEALCYVHERGLIHRDVAPDNILITNEGRPVLIDFGAVSRDLADTADLSSTVGLAKRYYTAPEQMRARARPAPAGDVYSMGAVLYRALSGLEPADGQERVDAMFLGRERDPYKPLMVARPQGCSPRVAQAIDKALAVRSSDRPGSMAELREQLSAPAPRRGSIFERVPTDIMPVAAAAGSSLLCVGYSQLLWPLIKDWIPNFLGSTVFGLLFGLSLATLQVALRRRSPGRLALLVVLTTAGWWAGYVGSARLLALIVKLDPKDAPTWSFYYAVMSLCGSAGTLWGCAIVERAGLGWKRTAFVVAAAAAWAAVLGVFTGPMIDVLNFSVYLLICFFSWQTLVTLGIFHGRRPSLE